MNAVLVFNILLLLTVATAQRTSFGEIYNTYIKAEGQNEKACLKENSLTDDDVQGFFKTGVISDNKQIKCFIRCLFLKANILTENGEIQLDNVKKFYSKVNLNLMEKFLFDCTSKVTEMDPCNKAVLIGACFIQEIKLELSKQQ